MEYLPLKNIVEEIVAQAAKSLASPSKKLTDAMRYALESGGKRLRPVLFLAAYSLGGKAVTPPVKKLCFAIEALHTYTLVHDDLPCMDNDDERRGKPSCHKKFGEAHALLAGDALLNLAAEYATKAILTSGGDINIIRAADFFFEQTGMSGVIGGQSLEFESVTKECDILTVMQHKTAALFEAAVVCGGLCGGLDEKRIDLLKECGHSFGMFFQLKDDINDMDESSFATRFGVQKAKKLMAEYAQRAVTAAKNARFDFMAEMIL